MSSALVLVFFNDFLPNIKVISLMVPFPHYDLLHLVKRVLLLILKADVVNPCTSITALKKSDLNEKANFLKAKQNQTWLPCKRMY